MTPEFLSAGVLTLLHIGEQGNGLRHNSLLTVGGYCDHTGYQALLSIAVSRTCQRRIHLCVSARPNLLVKVISYCVDGWLHDGDCSTDNKATTQGVSHRKGNGEVHNCKADGLGHESDLAVSYINGFRISPENHSHIWFYRSYE